MPTLDLNTIVSFLIEVALRLGAAALIFLAGRWLARWLRGRLQTILERTPGVTESMVTLLTTLAYYGSLLIVVVIGLAILGVPANVLAAAVAAAVIILGIAFQASLANFAATIIFLLFRPFAVGDDIETMGIMGTVQEIQLFNTVLLQPDLKVVTLPNARIQDSGITNYSRKGILRLSEVVGISYGDDVQRARNIVTGILAEDPRVLADPPAQVMILQFADSSVNLGIRPFVKTADFWPVQASLREQIKLKFGEAGITIPFPQREVHIVTPGETSPVSPARNEFPA